MFNYIQNMQRDLPNDRVIRLVLLRNDWELAIKKNDLIYQDGDALIITHKNGNKVLVNMKHISLVCTMAAGRKYYE